MPSDPPAGSFEWLRERLPDLPRATSPQARELEWIDVEHRLAVARDDRGRLELFLTGARLVASAKIVRDALHHQTWQMADGSVLDANRLVLPSADHYDGVAAFLCAELFENGFANDRERAFRLTEPAIALTLRRASLGNEVVLGLAGELYFLDYLGSRAAPAAQEDLVLAWAGSSPSARDFQFGHVGVEVKTTAGLSSTHHVQGVHQIEPGGSVGGAHETHLYLLSLGVQWLRPEDEGGDAIPRLVDRLLGRLDADLRKPFLARILQYGGDAGVGYDHERDRDLPLFTGRFALRFERLYDMSDPRIRLPRTSDLEAFTDLDVSSVAFRIALRDQVRGDVNPVSDMGEIARILLDLL